MTNTDAISTLAQRVRHTLESFFATPTPGQSPMREAIELLCAQVGADYGAFRADAFCPDYQIQDDRCLSRCPMSESGMPLCQTIPALGHWLLQQPERMCEVFVLSPFFDGQHSFQTAALAVLRVPGQGAALLCVAHRDSAYHWSEAERDALATLVGVFSLLHQRDQAMALATQVEGHERELMAASSDAMLIHDRQRVLFANPACARLVGHESADALLDAPLSSLLHADDLLVLRDQVHAVLSSDTCSEHRWQARLLRRDGPELPVEVSSHRLNFHGRHAVWTTLRDQSAWHDLTRQLHLSETYLDQVLRQLPVILWAVDGDNRFTLCVGTGLRGLPANLTPVVGARVQDCLASLPDFPFQIERARKGERFSALRRFGERLWLETHYTPMPDEQGRPGVIGMSFDVSDREQAAEQLQLSAQVFQHSGEGIVITDTNGKIIALNRAFERITGYTAQEAVGHTPALLASGRQDGNFYRDMWASLHEQGRWSGEIWNRRKSGEVYPEWLSITAIRNAEGAIHRFIGIFTDMTSRKEKERAIYQLANYDSLTLLPNRHLFNERARLALAAELAHGGSAAMLFVDLDGFKLVNDITGPHAGDALLVAMARRLHSCLDDDATLARLESDHFLILAPSVGGGESWRPLVERLLDAVRQPCTVDGAANVHLSASIGVSCFPYDADTVEVLAQQAESAMQEAKALGGDNFALFKPDLSERAAERFNLFNALKHAHGRDEFRLYVQPQFRLSDGKLIGGEALIRWQHPQWGLVSPARFIPVAEDTHLIRDISDWVLNEACRQRASWPAWTFEGEPLTIAINLSAVHFQDPGLPGKVQEALARYRLDARCLELEVTERTVMGDIKAIIAILSELKRIGVRLAIDDFGTGYSSLSYLRHFPIDRLKIDRSFVTDIASDTSAAAIVDTILNLARNLGLSVIAEGVETREQLALLTQRGCDEAQGYLLGYPSPEAEFIKRFLTPPAPAA
ncbi:sensor domain-containing protein [Rivihabitans pingtungensis]|uniref:sensor domain-containing protein n=1 Tax=Rivihabitans pingtungensis TaxID=1054498 RepID=UPI002353FDF4|nr:EAL domain-containing protein [Rivihabitans pingtungensis]MCK6435737.1 EAL domain-containing protein [Rivihabitans pingtungensis]